MPALHPSKRKASSKREAPIKPITISRRKADTEVESPKPMRKRLAFRVARDSTTKAKIKHNAEQSFLGRLPFEIRRRIYRLVLGDRMIHIYRAVELISMCPPIVEEKYDPNLHTCGACGKTRRRDWRHSVCQVPGATNRDYEHFHDEEPAPSDEYSRHVRCKSLAGDCWCRTHSAYSLDIRVLRACRQLYNECNDVLWTTNIFAFETRRTFPRFVNELNRIQKELLRCFYFDIKLEKPPAKREISTNTLLSLKGLRKVYIKRTEMGWQPFFSTVFKANTWILEPYIGRDILNLRLLKGLSEVYVVLPGHDYSSEARETAARRNHPYKGIVRRREHARIIEKIFLDPEGAKTRAQEIVMRDEYLRENKEWRTDRTSPGEFERETCTKICSNAAWALGIFRVIRPYFAVQPK